MVVLETKGGKSISTSARTIEDLKSTICLGGFTKQEQTELLSDFNQQTTVARAAKGLGPTQEEVEEQEQVRKQVDAALATGVNVSKDLLKKAGASKKEVTRIERRQKAVGDLAKIPGVKQGNSFDLVAALRGGASVKTIADAGFNPDVIDRAERGLREGRGVERVQLESDDALEQVNGALESGVFFGRDVLVKAGVSQEGIKEVLKRQDALSALKRVPGVENNGEFNLELALRSGVTREAMLDAGFTSVQIESASTRSQVPKFALNQFVRQEPSEEVRLPKFVLHQFIRQEERDPRLPKFVLNQFIRQQEQLLASKTSDVLAATGKREPRTGRLGEDVQVPGLKAFDGDGVKRA